MKATCSIVVVFAFVCFCSITRAHSQLVGWRNEDQCGIRPARQPKIINGTTAVHGNYPWLVSLLLNNRHHCGGSLIRPNWVLTAAHCVYRMNANRFKVKLGGHRRNVTSEETSIEVNVTKIVYHTGFSYATFADDLALVKLPFNVTYTSYIQPICLPLASSLKSEHAKATVAGWGKLRQGGLSADTLQEVELPLVDNTLCQSWFRQQGKTSIFVRPTQICAGLEQGGKDACQGDSGSPLMVTDPFSKRSSVIGIVSAGIGCALPKLPGLYTRVTSYLEWIDSTIQASENELNNSTTISSTASSVTQSQPSSTTTSSSSTSTAKPNSPILSNQTIVIGEESKPIKIINATINLMKYLI